MPLYTIAIKKSAEKEIAALPLAVVEKIYQALNELTIDPRPVGVKKLVGHKNLYRIRVSDYRIIYNIEDKVLQILILKVGHRKDIYR